MCNQYEEPNTPQDWKEVFDLLHVVASAPVIQGEVKPTDIAPIKRNTGADELEPASWWLRGTWDASSGKQRLTLFNARDDRLADAFWRDIAESQRCLVPATAYYEYQAMPGMKKKTKKRISPVSGQPFAMAGLWNEWHHKLTHTIVTTSPTPDVAQIHDRMPVILTPDLFDAWLSPERVPVEALVSLIRSRPPIPLLAADARSPEAQGRLW